MSQRGVLLVNLGSPNSPTAREVRRYLREFLMDGRVLDIPYLVRWFVVHCCILPARPRQSAEAYHAIWRPEGSPLIVSGLKTREELERRLGCPVELAMRYQNPSIPAAFEKLRGRGVEDLLVIPLFPHFAMSSYETAVERVKEVAARLAPRMVLRFQPPFYTEPDYIGALAASAAPYLERGYDHLLFSFHGLPERHLRKADPTGSHCLRVEGCCEIDSEAHRTCYRAQCFKTVQALVRAAGVTRYSVSFQSRLGKAPWLRPYTDLELQRLAREGVKRLLVICPAFIADCLETLEEIGIRGRAAFLAAGGREFSLIPCLNEHPRWIDALVNMAQRA